MLKIGITGGIGSGKSTVCKVFELLGIQIFYADAEAKKLYNTNEYLKSEMIKLFGSNLYQNGIFQKERLKEILFNDKNKLTLLNELVHPVVAAESEKWIQHHNDKKYILKEAALLIESGSYKQLDLLVYVESPLEQRIKRVMKRDGISKDAVLQRMNTQLPEEEKKQHAKYIIQNDEAHLLIPQVLELHKKFCEY